MPDTTPWTTPTVDGANRSSCLDSTSTSLGLIDDSGLYRRAPGRRCGADCPRCSPAWSGDAPGRCAPPLGIFAKRDAARARVDILTGDDCGGHLIEPARCASVLRSKCFECSLPAASRYRARQRPSGTLRDAGHYPPAFPIPSEASGSPPRAMLRSTYPQLTGSFNISSTSFVGVI